MNQALLTNRSTRHINNKFPTRAAYLAMKACWAKNKTVTTDKVLLYNLLRGLDPKRGFTPVTNKVKLDNGAGKYTAFQHAKWLLNWKVIRCLKDLETIEWFSKKPNREVIQEYLSSTFGPTVTIEIATEAIKGLE